MIEITPGFPSTDFKDLKEKLSTFREYVREVQIDVCDGKFVPSVSWPMHREDEESTRAILDEEEGMPFWTELDFEFDLMVINAHKQFEFFVQLGAKRVVFHLEAEEEKSFKEFLESLDNYMRDNIDIGLAINTTTDISKLDPFINLVDFVQCMGIEKIGFQGEPFDERVLTQIKSIKEKYGDVKISVDGSVNENTALALVKAGADRLVIGSALMHSYDMRGKISEFENIS